MIVIYVGDVTDRVRLKAQEYDSLAQIITKKNFKNLKAGTYYASLGDLSGLSEFIDILTQADKIVYVEEQQWSDTKNNFSYMKYWTEFYLYFFYSKKNVVLPRLDLAKSMLHLTENRISQNTQLWIAGCSISHGIGVENSQRYGQLIADRMDLPVSFLTCPGSSIEWAADQILRSDIRPGDIIVWGITNFTRLPYYVNNKVEHILPSYYETRPEFNSTLRIDTLDEPNMIYKAVTKIHQVINFCKKINVDLYLGGMLVTPEFTPYLVWLPNYIQMYGWPTINQNNIFIDIGIDDLHPGPKTHQWYADNFLTKILNA